MKCLSKKQVSSRLWYRAVYGKASAGVRSARRREAALQACASAERTTFNGRAVVRSADAHAWHSACSAGRPRRAPLCLCASVAVFLRMSRAELRRIVADLVVIFRTHSDVEASIVRGLLESHGVPTVISSDQPQAIFPVGIDALGQVRLAVHPDDAEE